MEILRSRIIMQIYEKKMTYRNFTHFLTSPISSEGYEKYIKISVDYFARAVYTGSLFLMNLAGLPPQISADGISFVMTLPAANIALSPILTALTIRVFIPMNTLDPIVTIP